jgi:hypothetical protein
MGGDMPRLLRSTSAALFGALLIFFDSGAAVADSNYLPPDTQIVVTVNIRQILNSELAKAHPEVIGKLKVHLEDALSDEEVSKYLKAAGFCFFEDLTCVTFAHPGGHEPDAGLLILEGRFSPKKVYAAAADAAEKRARVVSIKTTGKHRIIEVAPPQGKRAFIAVPSQQVMFVSANNDHLQSALVRFDANEVGEPAKELKALLENTSTKQSVSAVATGNALATFFEHAKIPNAQGAAPVFKSINGLSLTITVARDVQFELGISTKDEKSVQMLLQQTNFVLLFVKGLAATKAKEDERFRPLIDICNTLRASAQGVSLLFRGEVSVENIEKLRRNFHDGNP